MRRQVAAEPAGRVLVDLAAEWLRPGDRVELELGDTAGPAGSTSATVDWARGLQTFFRAESGLEAIARLA